ncbi:putative Testis-expressed sequence 2 protein [Naja naja]|nr:putative Testis-expressed sequence 2 protein [Naja naja]
MKVRPQLGEREVTFPHITEWIEKKLQHEFQKILVMPNMDDIILPLMHSGLESQPLTEGPQEELLAEDVRNM